MLNRLSLAIVLGIAAIPCLAQDQFVEGEAPPQVVAIGRMTGAVFTDGNGSGWPMDATSILLGQADQTVRRHVRWSGTEDCSGAVRLAWDDEYFYVGADVREDQPMQAETAAQVWQGDTLELFFNTYPRQQRADGFRQVAIVPPLKPGASFRLECPQKTFEGAEAFTTLRPTGYTVGCRIPWKNLAGFRPAYQAELGFQVYIDHRDDRGRKVQLAWYPSIITYSRPTHTNVLVLREHGQTALPRVLAGPNTWCVTNPSVMDLSVVTDVEGAVKATICSLPADTSPEPSTRSTTGASALGPVDIELKPACGRISTGKGTMDIRGALGQREFLVTARDANGRVVATNTFRSQLVGADYARMLELARSVRRRLTGIAPQAAPPADGPGKTHATSAATRPGVDAQGAAGIDFWINHCNAFIGNEARPERVNGRLLQQVLAELADIDLALNRLAAGEDPYVAQRGCFVLAYRSPLTGRFRPHALWVPKEYGQEPNKHWPLIVLLHGIFADDRQLAGMADTFKDLGAIVYQAAAYSQLDWSGVSAAETWSGLEEVKARYRIDEDRVYLVGSAIGGRGAWQLAMARPDLWAAAAPLLSGTDTRPSFPALRLYEEYYDQAIRVNIPAPLFMPPPPPEPARGLERQWFERMSLAGRVPNILRLPLWSAHGEDDPDATAERLAMETRLSQLGRVLTTRYVPGAMHGSSPQELCDKNFYRWLLSHRRPAYPARFTYAADGLRYNGAWWARVEQTSSPAQLAQIEASIADGNVVVTTANATAITLIPDTLVAAEGSSLAVRVDGQGPIHAVAARRGAGALSLVRKADGAWAPGEVPAGQKCHGMSGPIDDFQFGRFLVVYGTGGDQACQAVTLNAAKQISDWGLGTTFESKADRDVTRDDIASSHLLLIGTPKTNCLLAAISASLPATWTDSGVRIGDVLVEGPGAGACMIHPNPLSPAHYVVVVTAWDQDGYRIWDARTGLDYVLGRARTADGKSTFEVAAQGWFDNHWQCRPELCIRKK